MGKKKNKKTSSRDFDRGLMSKFYGPGKEAQDMLKRYDVEGYRQGGRAMEISGKSYRGVDEIKKDLGKAMMNDYDTRRTMEAAALSGNEDAQKFTEKGFKAGNIQEAYGVLKDLKKEHVGGGGMLGAQNRASLTQALVEHDRDAQTAQYEGMFAGIDDFNKLKDEMNQAPAADAEPEEIERSDRLQGAYDRLEDAAQGNSDMPSLFAQDNEQPAANDDQKQAATNFLEDYKLDVIKGANIKHDIDEGLSNASKHVRNIYGR